MMKAIFLGAMLALAGFAAEYGASYDLVFSSPMRIDDLTLQAGEYRLTVNGETATFTRLHRRGYSFPVEGNTAVFTRWVTNRQYAAPVAVKTGGEINVATTVFTNDVNDTNEIERIALGGTSTELEFGGAR